MHEHVWGIKQSWIGYGLEGSKISRAFIDKTSKFYNTSNYPLPVAEMKPGKNLCIIGWFRLIYIYIFSSIKFYNPIQSLDSQVIYFIVALLELTGMIDDGMELTWDKNVIIKGRNLGNHVEK